MKVTTFLIFLLGFFVNAASAQSCDIAQTGVAVVNEDNSSPVSFIGMGERANFKFSVFNMGSALDCAIPANSVSVKFSFPTLPGGVKPYIYEGPASFVSGYFTWTYNAATEELTGRNTVAIPNGTGDNDVLVRVIGNAEGTAASNLNLLPLSSSDNILNNSSAAQLIVRPSSTVPVKLSSFKALADKCDAVLNWSTASESAFGHFDVEYSYDGRTYIKIGAVPGKNAPAGAAYSFTYSQLSGTGYYRLKLVDMDGHTDISNIVRATTNCKDKPQVLVYPNPVQYDQNLVVNITGYNGRIEGTMVNAAGQAVKGFTLSINSNNLSVSELAAGTYVLKIKNDGQEVGIYKIVITR